MVNPDISDIANGYRNVCYRVGTGGQGEIVLYGWDKSGNRDTFIFPFDSSLKYEVKTETENKTIFDTYANVKYFKNSWERKKWIDAAAEGINILEAFNPEQEFLINNFSKNAFDDNFNNIPLRIHFFDLEVAIENEFPKPEDAKYPINIITIYDSLKKKYYSWVLGLDTQNTITDKNLVLNKFATEHALLMDFIGWFSNNYPDVFTGWNTYFFDMLYLVKRLENVLGEKYAKMMSPIGKYYIKQKKGIFTKNYVSIQGISHLDLKILYEDKFKIADALDGGYSLSNVCLHEGLGDKMTYEGSMKDFYKQNFQKFFEYNIRDVELTVLLEDKLQMIPLARKICTLGLSQYEQIYGSVSYIIGSLSIYSKNNYNKIFKSFYRYTEDQATEFEGAYVFPTISGFYKNGIACVDFNSLYPNTAVVLNLSPETKVGQLIDNNDGTYLIRGKNSSKVITKEILDKLLDKKCILSKNNTLFYKHEVKSGIFAEWCKYFYDTRKKYQKLKNQEIKKLDELKSIIKTCKDPEQKKKLKADKSEIEKMKFIYHITQYALKIMINSAYGVLGCKFSPIYDADLAQSITLNGQFANKSCAEYIKKRFIQKYNCSEDFQVTVSGDTDSIAGDSILDVKFNS